MSDTSLGGGFPETTWGLVSRLRETAAHRQALEALCTRYWKPVYTYVRLAWRKSDADARDLTQAFFLWLLDGEPLKRYEPERGGLRPYLKVLLRRFVSHQEVAMQRLKRGGGALHLSIEDVGEPPAGEPEEAFDRAWIAELVRQAVDRVRARTDATAFAVYEAYDLGESRPTYAELAERHAIPLNEVKNHLFRVREHVRGEIRADLAQMTSGAAELEEEYGALFRT